MNSTVGPNFKEKFAEILSYKSCEQYMRPTQKTQMRCYPNLCLIW